MELLKDFLGPYSEGIYLSISWEITRGILVRSNGVIFTDISEGIMEKSLNVCSGESVQVSLEEAEGVLEKN